MSLHTFPTQQLQFISYEGPPEPKQSKYAKKTPVNEGMCSDHDGILNTKPRPNAGQGSRGNSTCTPSGAEIIDLTYSTNEPNRQLSDEREVDDDLLSYDDGLLSKNKCQSTVPKQFVATPTWEDPCDESSKNAVVIEDSQFESEIDENWPWEDDMGTQIGNQPENSCNPAPKHRGEERLTGVEDAIMFDAINETRAQASEPSYCEVMPTPSTGLSVTSTEQPTQRTTDYTPLEAKTHQPQRLHKRAEEDKSRLYEITNRSSDSSEPDDAEDDNSDHTTPPTRKRKRSLLPKQYSQTPSTILNQRPGHARHPARHHKPSSVRGKPNRPKALKPLSAAEHGGCNADTRSGHDSSNENARYPAMSKRSTSTTRPIRSHRHKRNRNCGITEQDIEYEVEEILEARVYYRKLQYRVKWVGYADDLEWYNAANFKNSPYKLRDFHTANSICPGPPTRLDYWVACWEQGGDANDHPDDNKSRRPRSAGRT